MEIVYTQRMKTVLKWKNFNRQKTDTLFGLSNGMEWMERMEKLVTYLLNGNCHVASSCFKSTTQRLQFIVNSIFQSGTLYRVESNRHNSRFHDSDTYVSIFVVLCVNDTLDCWKSTTIFKTHYW